MAVKPLADHEKRKSDLPMGPGSRPTLISESGLYKLVMRSDKPEAKAF
jgi:prophage antirepressor-like protein